MADTIIEGEVRAYDEVFMREALKMALKAYNEDEVPIGAVVVSPEGEIIGRGFNRTEQECTQSRHAEVCALEQAGKQVGDWRLSGCTLYVTVEPCIMCMGLIGLSRVKRVVYGAKSPLFGSTVDRDMLPSVYKHIEGVTSGVGELEVQELMKSFFKKKRMKGEEHKRDQGKIVRAKD